MIIAKIKFGILLCCLPMLFLIFSLVFWMLRVVFNVFSMMFAKMSLLMFAKMSENVCVVPYGVMRNLDAIIRVRMMLCETSMLLFVSVWCYAKPRCYYVSNHVCLNLGLQRARSLWSGDVSHSKLV